MELSDRFRDQDVWYDGTTGEFVSFELTDENNVVMVTPPYEQGSVIIYEFEDEDEWENAQDDFIPVPEVAYENPAEYYTQKVEEMEPVEFDVGFMFSKRVTEVKDTRE